MGGGVLLGSDLSALRYIDRSREFQAFPVSKESLKQEEMAKKKWKKKVEKKEEKKKKDEEEKNKEPLDLSIELASSNGVSVRLPASLFRNIPPILKSRFTKYKKETEFILDNLRDGLTSVQKKLIEDIKKSIKDF